MKRIIELLEQADDEQIYIVFLFVSSLLQPHNKTTENLDKTTENLDKSTGNPDKSTGNVNKKT